MNRIIWERFQAQGGLGSLHKAGERAQGATVDME